MRRFFTQPPANPNLQFPFLFGGTFIEADDNKADRQLVGRFPFLFGGTFIEAATTQKPTSESLPISLPFRRDFH